MKLRQLAFGAGLALAAAALAGLMVVWSTMGHGVVTNHEGRSGRFEVGAHKRVHNGSAPAVGGGFVLDFSTATAQGTRLRMQAREYAQEGKTSFISGPAVLRILREGNWHEIQGHARARFTSNRHPDEAGEPDTLEVGFAREKFTWGFGGRVTHGDLTVSRTESH